MPLNEICNGCHIARQEAIDAADQAIAITQERIRLTTDAIDVLQETEVPAATAALRRVPEDYEDTYAEPLKLIRAGGSMPADGDFITGHGSRLAHRNVTGRAADMIRSVLQLAHGQDDLAHGQDDDGRQVHAS
jgi:hypothetical protein